MLFWSSHDTNLTQQPDTKISVHTKQIFRVGPIFPSDKENMAANMENATLEKRKKLMSFEESEIEEMIRECIKYPQYSFCIIFCVM